MSSPLKSAIETLRIVTTWVRRADSTLGRTIASHPKEAEAVHHAAEMTILPLTYLGKLIWKATDPMGSANRFANNLEQAVGHTLSYSFGTSTLLDMPRF